MRILTIGSADNPHTLRPVRSLLARGHSVFLLATVKPKNGKPPFAKEQLPGFSYLFENNLEETVLKLQVIRKSFKPDIIHVHWVDWHVLLCAKLDLRPLVVSVWGSDVNCAIAETAPGVYSWKKNVESTPQYLCHADHIIVDDITMPGKCAFIAPNVPMSLLHLGVDEIFFEGTPDGVAGIRKRLNLNESHVFTACRVLGPAYRNMEILQAFAQAAKGKDALLIFRRFHVMDEKLELQLKAEAKKLGIEKQVRFYNGLSQEDLRNLYAASTALINFPSRDAFPVTFAEAAAAGATVITCRHPAYNVPLVENCFDILPENSVAALADAIAKYLNEQIEIDADKAQYAREIARTEYSHNAYIQGLEDIYTSLHAARSNI